MSDAETVVDATRKFVSVLDDYTASMPRARKFTIGDRLLARGMLLLESVVEAYYLPHHVKKQKIAEANVHCEVIRQLLRLLFEKGIHNLKKHEKYSRELDTIGKSLGGWLKAVAFEVALTLDAVAGYENLHIAFLRASKGRRKRHDMACFGMHWEDHLIQLRDELLSGHYRPGGYKLFTVHEKKTRLIMAASFIDRIVHHAICNLLTPVLERSMVASSCANRVGKGTSAGLELFGKFTLKYDYVLKCDIRRFFASIDRAILMESLQPKIHDRRLYELVSAIIAIAPEYGIEFDYFLGDSLLAPCEHIRGLPIGNMTSQTWANWYLNGLDHYIMDYLGFGAYLRYVDDFAVFSSSKESLNCLKENVARYLERLRLHIHPEKSRVYRVTDGVPFLGFRHYPEYRTLHKQNIRRFKRRLREKLKMVCIGQDIFASIRNSIAGWSGHARMGDTWRLRESLCRKLAQWRGLGERLPRAAWGLVEQQQRQQSVRGVPQQQQSGQQEQQQRFPGRLRRSVHG